MHTLARMLQPQNWLAGYNDMALGLYWCTWSDRFCTLLLSSCRQGAHDCHLVQQQNKFVVGHCCKAHMVAPGAINCT